MSGAFTNFDELPRGHFGAGLADPPWKHPIFDDDGEQAMGAGR